MVSCLQVDSSNLASIIMGKNIWLPWRGQRNTMIQIPFDEWLTFISENRGLLSNRSPLDYSRILDEDVPDRKKKFFLIECSWAQFNEVMVSSSRGQDACVIVPICDDSLHVEVAEAINEVKKFTSENFSMYYGRLTRMRPRVAEIPIQAMSSWNVDVLMLSVYLQYMAYQNPIKLITVDWR